MDKRLEIKITKALQRELEKEKIGNAPRFRVRTVNLTKTYRKYHQEWHPEKLLNLPQPDIDLAILDNRRELLMVEVKYFKLDKKGNIDQPYYSGIDQALALIRFGPKCVSLWHCFDEEMPIEKIDTYSRNTAKLIRVLALPINYAMIKIEKGDSGFIFKEIPIGYTSRAYERLPNPYGTALPDHLYNNAKEMRNFIIGAVFKASVP